MPLGNPCFSLPFGPCTSTAPSSTVTVTPLGMTIGFFPIRDMVCSPPLPDVAQHLAADSGLDRFAAGHHAARGREDAGAEPGQHLRYIGPAEIDAAARPADALDAGDELLTMRAVLEEEPQRLDGSGAGGLLEDLEALDVALVLQDPRDVDLDARRGHVDPRVLRGHRVPDPGQHVGDGISHIVSPAALGHPGHVALERELAEAQAAQAELPHV